MSGVLQAIRPNPSVRTLSLNGTARVALLGLGGAADRILLPAIATLKGVQVVAGCDSDDGTRARAAAKWKIARTYADADEMLTVEKPDIAVVATPPLTHGALCLLALEHGCHVFCEKPFMPSIEEADRVISAAQTSGCVVAVNNQYYQMPIFRAVTQLLDNGRAGRLYHIDTWQRMHLLPEDEGGWKAALQPKRVLYEFGTHALDLICHFFKAYPIAVSARIPRVQPQVDADVFVVVRLDFPEDRVANLVLNRVSHAPKKYLEMRLDCEQASLRTSLGGVAYLQLGWNSASSRPHLRVSLATGGEARWERHGHSRTLVRQPHGAVHQAAGAHFSQFLSAIRNSTQPQVSATHAREVLRAVFGAYASASHGGELVRLC